MVEKENVLKELRSYESELTGILERFEDTSDGIYINDADDPRFRQVIIELQDFLNDILGKNHYSQQIYQFFHGGIANFTSSPSYQSVENIRGVVSAIITRLERNPKILSSVKVVHQEALAVPSHEPEVPQTVTLSWLWRNVPYKFWIVAAGLLLTAFYLGIQASRLSLVQEILKISK